MSFLGDDTDPDLTLLAETVTISSGEAIMVDRHSDHTEGQRIVWLDGEAVINGTDERKTIRVVFGRELALRTGILFIQAIGKEEIPDGS